MQSACGNNTIRGWYRWFALVLLCVLPLMTTSLLARSDSEREFEFARGLIRLNMPELAEQVMDRLVLQNPELDSRANVIRAEAMIHRRQLAAAEEILRSMPADSSSAQAILLALADAYFLIGERDKTREIYTEFFQQYEGEVPTDPDVIRFLLESAYKYVQMLIHDQDYQSAVVVYDLLLDVVDKRDQSRQIMLEQAEVALKAAEETIALSEAERETLYQKAEENFTEVLWGGMDHWFGRALTAYARYMVLRGNLAEAREMLQSNIQLMEDMDEQLREANIPVSESPMAGARSLLGKLYMDEGQLMVAPDPERHDEILACFERALQAFATEWRIMERAKRREDAAREAGREPTDDSLRALTGRPERMQPYNDMVAVLEEFLATVTDVQWDLEVTERAREMESGLRELYNKVRDFDFEPGISPSLGISIDENFDGKIAISQGLELLRPEEERRADAVQLLVQSLTEYYNVFSEYAGSHWSTTAGEIVGQLRNLLFELTGRRVVIDVGPDQEERIATVHFREGDSLHRRSQHREAIESYLMGLNVAGESADALNAISNMMEAHARLDETYMVRMLAGYLAERFADRPVAAQALLRIGRHYFDAQEMEMYHELYELFLESFADHDRAPGILFMLGEQQWRVKDYPGSEIYYRRVVERYPQSPQSLSAMNRIAWGHFLVSDYSNAVTAFNDYLEVAPASQEKAQAKLCLAESYRMSGRPRQALQAYETLVSWLEPDPNPYTASTEQKRENREILMQAHFFRAFCYSQIHEPETEVPQYREKAIEIYQSFIDTYPRSRLAPIAMASLGAVFFERGNSDEAARVFEQLAESYPDSEAGQNARFAMIRSLVDIGRMDKAKEVFDEMLRDHDRYSPGQFARVAQLMLEHEEYTASEKAFLLVKDATEERAVLERTLFGLGRVQSKLGKHSDAVANIEDLIRRYPNTGHFYEARFLLAHAFSEQGKFSEAIRSMHDVFNRASDNVMINRASLELAKLQLRSDDRSGALASFQRVVLLSDPNNPEIRPIYEQALLGSIRLYRDNEQWEEVIESCDLYMRYFTLADDADQVRRWRSEALMQRSSG